MATFTSSLPDDLLTQLNDYADDLSLPKNKLMEKALRAYFLHLKKQRYRRSYQQAAQDQDLVQMVNEDMAAYGNLLKESDDQAG